MYKAILPFLLLGLSLAPKADAQAVALSQNSLPNQDVVALAGAGCGEGFLIDLVGRSRTRFDTSANALAELAKQGITERLIRAMLNPLEISSQTTVALSPPEASATPAPAGHRTSGGNRKSRVPKTSELMLAITNQAPYFRSSSLMWGLWRSKTGVGSQSVAEPNIASPLLAVFGKGGR